MLVGANAVCSGLVSSDEAMLQFGMPVALSDQLSADLEGAARWLPVTLPLLLQHQASHYAWLTPGETNGCDVGGFAYRFKGDAGTPRFFPIATEFI
jgi:hypothetical protein